MKGYADFDEWLAHRKADDENPAAFIKLTPLLREAFAAGVLNEARRRDSTQPLHDDSRTLPRVDPSIVADALGAEPMTAEEAASRMVARDFHGAIDTALFKGRDGITESSILRAAGNILAGMCDPSLVRPGMLSEDAIRAMVRLSVFMAREIAAEVRRTKDRPADAAVTLADVDHYASGLMEVVGRHVDRETLKTIIREFRSGKD